MNEITETELTSHSQSEHLVAFDSLVDLTTFVDTEPIFKTEMHSSRRIGHGGTFAYHIADADAISSYCKRCKGVGIASLKVLVHPYAIATHGMTQ